MTLYGVELVRVEDEKEVASLVADALVAAARAGAALVLTGGDSPGRAYELAAQREPDWSAATLWWGDERCVPPEDERSNFGLARQRLLEAISAEPREVHRIRGELGAESAADETTRSSAARRSIWSCSAWARTATRPPSTRISRRWTSGRGARSRPRPSSSPSSTASR